MVPQAPLQNMHALAGCRTQVLAAACYPARPRRTQQLAPPSPRTCALRLKPHLVLAHRVPRAALVARARRRHGPVCVAHEVQAAAGGAVLGDVPRIHRLHKLLHARGGGWGGGDNLQIQHRWLGQAAQAAAGPGTAGARDTQHASWRGGRSSRGPRHGGAALACMRSSHSGGMPEASRSSGEKLPGRGRGRGGAAAGGVWGLLQGSGLRGVRASPALPPLGVP